MLTDIQRMHRGVNKAMTEAASPGSISMKHVLASYETPGSGGEEDDDQGELIVFDEDTVV
jgi:hypothetical protein